MAALHDFEESAAKIPSSELPLADFFDRIMSILRYCGQISFFYDVQFDRIMSVLRHCGQISFFRNVQFDRIG